MSGTFRWLAAAFPAALVAVAAPAAEAAYVAGDQQQITVLDRFFDGGTVEENNLVVRPEGSTLVLTDTAGVTVRGTCVRVSATEARCPATRTTKVVMNLHDGDDRIEYRAPNPGGVNLGPGHDRAAVGLREGNGLAEPFEYFGGPGQDTVNYSGASRGVSLTPEDGIANDGRPGDRENIRSVPSQPNLGDFEFFLGSHFDDRPFFGTAGNDSMIGLGGNDQIAGGHGNDAFTTLPGDGADDYHGGPGTDTISYEGRTQPVLVSLDNVANDGEKNERDQVRSNVENIIGGSAGDVLESFGAFSRLEGRGGDDFLYGGDGPDTLIGGPGADHLDAGAGNDHVDARDGQLDTIDCGDRFDTDSLTKDGQERRVVDCEKVQVGVLKLKPEGSTAAAGRPATLQLSWRHPQAWRKLRRIELRLLRDGAPVGALTIRPRAGRIAADGDVELLRKRTRLTHKGKTVIARLALRFDPALAGQKLEAEVEATDARGARQLERKAATIRVR